MTVRISIIDESPIFRLGLKQALRGANVEITGEAGDGAAGQRLIRQKQPEIVLLSADLFDGMSIAVCDFTAAHFSEIQVIFLINPNDLTLLNRLLNTAAKGFVTKNLSGDIGDAIKMVRIGRTYLQPDIGLMLIRLREKQTFAAINLLTDREYQILMMLARSKTSEEIADLMHISVRTVFNLKSSIFKKLAIHNVEQLHEVMSR